jgi:hypothetical protein
MTNAMKYYRIAQRFHLGDRWARLNYALRLLEAGEQFAISLPDADAHRILDALDTGALKIETLPPEPAGHAKSHGLIRKIDACTDAYHCRYFPTKQRHCPDGRVIGCAVNANWRAGEKVPSDIGARMQDLQRALPGWRLQPLGLPHQANVSELVDALCGVQLLVSVDNGVAHVARSVGVPLFLIEHRLPIARGFPEEACERTVVTADSMVECVVEFCGRRVSDGGLVERK